MFVNIVPSVLSREKMCIISDKYMHDRSSELITKTLLSTLRKVVKATAKHEHCRITETQCLQQNNTPKLEGSNCQIRQSLIDSQQNDQGSPLRLESGHALKDKLLHRETPHHLLSMTHRRWWILKCHPVTFRGANLFYLISFQSTGCAVKTEAGLVPYSCAEMKEDKPLSAVLELLYIFISLKSLSVWKRILSG